MAYELIEEEVPEESYLQSGLRNVARQGSNLATRAIGLPGDLFSMVNEYIANPVVESLGGSKTPYEETFLGKSIPTTETHRKGVEEVTGEYLKPKNDVERFVDDVVEDTALLFAPGSKGVKLSESLPKSFAKSVGANVAGKAAKDVSGDENTANLTKAGSLFLLSLVNKESAAKQVGKLYTQAEANLPSGAIANANKLEKNIDSLERSITKGRPKTNLSPPEKFVVDQSEKIRNLIQNGEISVEQAIAQKRSLHKELSTLYKEVPKFSDQKSVKNLAKQLSGFLNNTIEEYGKTNPKFIKPYKDADQAFGTLAKSNFMSHWIDKNVIQHPMTTGLLHVFSPLSSGAAAAVIPYQATKLTYRIAKSPTLRKIYAQTLKSAAKEDSKAFNKYLKQLDKSIQEEENQDRFEFID